MPSAQVVWLPRRLLTAVQGTAMGLGWSVSRYIEAALQRFSLCSVLERHDVTIAFWLDGQSSAWEPLALTADLMELARQVRAPTYSAQQCLVAAVQWYNDLEKTV